MPTGHHDPTPSFGAQKSAILLRPLHREDLDPLLFLLKTDSTFPWNLSLLLKLLLHAESIAFLAMDEQAPRPSPLGVILARGESWQKRIWVFHLLVREPWRKRGLGRSLLRLVERIQNQMDFRLYAWHLQTPPPPGEPPQVELFAQAERFLHASGFEPSPEASPREMPFATGKAWGRP